MKFLRLVILTTFWLLMIIPNNETAMARAKISETPPAIKARQSFLVLTRESWGCLRGQEIKGDATALISGDQGPGVRWEEIRNPEDRDRKSVV